MSCCRMLPAILCLLFSAGCAFLRADSLDATAEGVTCSPWKRIYYGPYILNNNVWGECAAAVGDCVPGYSQCIMARPEEGSMVFAWTWDWPPVEDERVKASPGIIYGRKPWDKRSTTSALPRRLSDVGRLSATFEASVSGTGIYNLAFDLWITGSSRPSPENRTGEVMIWVDAGHWDHAAGVPVVINGEEYDFYKDDGGNGAWSYLAFFKTTPTHSGTIHIHEFLGYLIAQGHVSENEYLASIEFLNEVREGSGRTEVRNYSIIMD